MKNKLFTVIFLIFIFVIFVLYNISKEIEHEFIILKVIEADEFYIDYNKNNKIEKNEFTKLSGIKAFSPIKNKNAQYNLKSLNLNQNEFLTLGLLAKNWAIDNLEHKKVRVKILKNKPCKTAKIEFKNQDLSIFLLEHGLAYSFNSSETLKYQNIIEIKNNAKNLSNLEYISLNRNSNVYHDFSCKHSKLASNIEIFFKKNFKNKEYFPCKACLAKIKQENLDFKYNIPKNKNIYKTIFHDTFNEIDLFLISPFERKNPNNNCDNVLCKRLIKEIDSANQTIDIAIYGLGKQNAIFEALKRAKSRGVRIRFVLDKSKNSDEMFPYNEKIKEEFDFSEDSENSLMHNKIFIFDNKKVLSGSTNITSSGIGGYNANIALIINSSKLANYCTEEFEQMFFGKFSKQKKILKTKEIFLKQGSITPYFSPKDNSLNNAILPLIQNAKEEIFVSAFYLTDRHLIKELIKAKNKGVNVIVLLDALSATNMQDRVIVLRNSKIPLKVENWGGKNHEKTILIDSSTLITGSCNFSYAGFNKNDENILIIKNEQIAKTYRDYFLFLFNSLDDKYLKIIPRSESFESINSCFDGIDNNFDGKTDSQDIGCQKH